MSERPIFVAFFYMNACPNKDIFRLRKEFGTKCVAENGARVNATARYMIADGGAQLTGLLTYKAN